MANFENQIEVMVDRDAFHRMVDELQEGDIALLASRTKDADGDSQLSFKVFGNGIQTEFAGLIMYVQAIMYRHYFRND